MRVNDPSVESVRLHFLRIKNSTYLIAIIAYGYNALISVLQRSHPGIPFLELLCSHPEINLCINWAFSC